MGAGNLGQSDVDNYHGNVYAGYANACRSVGEVLNGNDKKSLSGAPTKVDNLVNCYVGYCGSANLTCSWR